MKRATWKKTAVLWHKQPRLHKIKQWVTGSRRIVPSVATLVCEKATFINYRSCTFTKQWYLVDNHAVT